MVTFVVPPSPVNPIVEQDATMSQEFREWTQMINIQSTIIGTGSPETFIEAEIGAEYMDAAGTTGAIKYIKRDADDGLGDRSKGWILI